jgi:septum formation protein
MRPLILGSSSRYRAELLRRLQVHFDTAIPNIDESPLVGESPRALAVRLARQKAQAIYARSSAQAIVIGSDQVANRGGECIGKPGSREGAIDMLSRSSGKTLIFHSAVCVCSAEGLQEFVVDTECQFRVLSSADIESYVEREPSFDCAGSFKSESLGISLFDAMRSDDPTALIGLPLIRLSAALRQLHVL